MSMSTIAQLARVSARQMYKQAGGAKKGLGRVQKLLTPDVPTPKVKPKPKPKVTAPTPKPEATDLPLETAPRGELPAGHVDTPGTPTQFGRLRQADGSPLSAEQKAEYIRKLDQRRANEPQFVERRALAEARRVAAENAFNEIMLKRHNQTNPSAGTEQYDDLLKKWFNLTGQEGPILMPGHPAYKYPDKVPFPARIPSGAFDGPGYRTPDGRTPRQRAAMGKTSS